MKKKLWQKWTAAALAALLCVWLAGCGGGAPIADNAAPASMAAPGSDGSYAYSDETSPEDPSESWRYAEQDPEEEYDDSPETPFKDVATSPVSTFSADVDTASYSNMRRFINYGQQPEGVRIEELVNYFDYNYPRPAPDAEHPFSVTGEVAPCPWNEDHLLAMIGVQGADLPEDETINSNIVFLLDVSGSMDAPDKLPLLKESFQLLIDRLDKNDVVSVVTYAGSDAVVAEAVPGDQKNQLKRAINNLGAGGSTAGAGALRTAYGLAEENFIGDGNNRVILATDGDFNVGESSEAALQKLIEEEREKGVFISVLGFGMGNLKDDRMETIADNGNGNYAYIDTIEEAQKVLVDEFESTMFTIAKDLKLQAHFNPEVVSQYRLIGYNNRRLENEDFNDDQKDAGDIGAGHSVTAFYELIPAGAEGQADVDAPVYQQTTGTGSTDFMTVRLRYKQPAGEESILVEHVVGAGAYTEEESEDFAFASAVAEFGLILTDSQYRANASLAAVTKRAQDSLGRDAYGLRAEFVSLVDKYRGIVD